MRRRSDYVGPAIIAGGVLLSLILLGYALKGLVDEKMLDFRGACVKAGLEVFETRADRSRPICVTTITNPATGQTFKYPVTPDPLNSGSPPLLRGNHCHTN
jgi:hypothetical protein